MYKLVWGVESRVSLRAELNYILECANIIDTQKYVVLYTKNVTIMGVQGV